jgi:hypothetical protein
MADNTFPSAADSAAEGFLFLANSQTRTLIIGIKIFDFFRKNLLTHIWGSDIVIYVAAAARNTANAVLERILGSSTLTNKQ